MRSVFEDPMGPIFAKLILSYFLLLGKMLKLENFSKLTFLMDSLKKELTLKNSLTHGKKRQAGKNLSS